MPDLPSTPQSAPPNFYSMAGQMAAGQGQTQGGQGAPAPGATGKPAPMDQDHEFLETVTKLLGVLAKIGQMTPRGQDVTKYTQAAADAMKDCVQQVFNQDMDTPGGDATAGTSAATPSSADMGAGAGAAAGVGQ